MDKVLSNVEIMNIPLQALLHWSQQTQGQYHENVMENSDQNEVVQQNAIPSNLRIMGVESTAHTSMATGSTAEDQYRDMGQRMALYNRNQLLSVGDKS